MATRETEQMTHLSPVVQKRLAWSPGGVAYASCLPQLQRQHCRAGKLPPAHPAVPAEP